MSGAEHGGAVALDDEVPSAMAVARVVRRALELPPSSQLTVREVKEHTNVNFVFHVTGEQISVFVKAATSKLKAFDLHAPRERVVQEADRARQFRSLCGDVIEIPAVVFLDREAFMVGLEDVGDGRQVMLDALDAEYPTCTKDAQAWGEGLGRLCRASRVSERPGESVSADSVSPGQAVWFAIMAPGALRLFPEAVDAVLRPLCERQECLVHTDLWGKNILVHAQRRPALLDFENAGVGDPAVDVSALLTALLIPCLEDPVSKTALYTTFVEQFGRAYMAAIADPEWGRRVLVRGYHAVSANLAHRAVGLAPYPMSSSARERAVFVARELFRTPPQNAHQFLRTTVQGVA